MKISIPVAQLLNAVSAVHHCVAQRTTKPILGCIKLNVAGGILSATATDLEQAVKRTVVLGTEDTPDFDCVIDPKRLLAILKELSPTESVTLSRKDDTVKIVSTSAKWELQSQPVDDFPDIPESGTGVEFDIVGGVFKQAMKRTVFAAERRENTRYAVTGIYLEIDAEANVLSMVATDTKRLALEKVPVTNLMVPEGKQTLTGLLPVKAMQLVERNLNAPEASIRVRLGTNDCTFTLDNAVIYTRLVEGRFPPFRQFIPRKLKPPVQLGTPEFASCIRRAAITTDDESKRVDFHFEPGKVTLQSRGPECGSSEVEMSLPGYDGAEVNIAFDPDFLTEMMKAIDGESAVSMELSQENDRAIFRIGGDYMYLVVPMV